MEMVSAFAIPPNKKLVDSKARKNTLILFFILVSLKNIPHYIRKITAKQLICDIMLGYIT